MKQNNFRFRVGRRTYFHHQNGIVVRKNKLRGMAITTTMMMTVFGGFFVGVNYALPALKNSKYFQNSQNVETDAVLAPQEQTNKPTEAPIKQEDELLKQAIAEKLSSFPKNQKWSVLVYDLSADRTVNLNVDQEYDSASLYKLFLLEALENKLPQDKWKTTKVQKVRVADCVEKMLKVEDDPCSEALAEFVGWDFIDDFNSKNGYTKTKVTGSEGRKTTAGEVGELLIRLKKGHILSDKSRRFVFDALYQQNYQKGIGLACSNCRAAMKTGELTGVSHDVGVVTHGANSYVVAVMSQGGSFDQIAELTKIIDSRFSSAVTNQIP